MSTCGNEAMIHIMTSFVPAVGARARASMTASVHMGTQERARADIGSADSADG